MSKRVFVTGMGMISAVGNNVAENLHALQTGKTAMGPTAFIDTRFRDEIPLAEIKLSNAELSEKLAYKSKTPPTRASLLGLVAACEAVQHRDLFKNSKHRTGFISSTSVGGMDKTEGFFVPYLHDNSKGRLRDIVGHDCGESSERIARYFGIHEYVSTISTACSSSANAIMTAARLIKNNLMDRMLAGGVDSLTKFTINGFNSLMVLDRAHCRPFDDSRSGLNLGEGAAFLLLESEEAAASSGREILAEVTGYGNACDAYHQTASSPDGTGARLAMQKALDTAGLQAQQISYINAHGTATPNNDLSEGKALVSIFGKKLPPFSSTKPFTGHTLGAAGSIEAVLSILAIQHQLVFPNLNFTTPMADVPIVPVTGEILSARIKHVLSNSFGFGGNNSTLIFSQC